MIEAMACGTLVLALRRGSVGEVVTDGVTGAICDSIDEMGERYKAVADQFVSSTLVQKQPGIPKPAGTEIWAEIEVASARQAAAARRETAFGAAQ